MWVNIAECLLIVAYEIVRRHQITSAYAVMYGPAISVQVCYVDTSTYRRTHHIRHTLH